MSLTTLGAEAVLGFQPRRAGTTVRQPFVRLARPLAGVSLALLVIALVLSLPAAHGAGVPPPQLRATLSGVQVGERISYALLLENIGQLPAVNGQVQFALPAGLTAEGGGGALPIRFPPLNIGERIELAFVAMIDNSVATGTVAVVAAHVGYEAPGGSQVYETIAQSQISVAPRGGIIGSTALWALIGILAAGVLLVLGYAWDARVHGVRIDQLYLLHDSGMLITHYARAGGIQRDSDIMSGMFVVLQDFVRDSFNDPRGSLEEMRFGDRRFLMARGEHLIMAALVTGKRLNRLPARLRRAIEKFEGAHGATLREWNGNLETLGSADAALRSVLSPKDRSLPPT